MIDQTKGTLKDVAGKAQDAFGGATGDAATQMQGKARQVAGKVQQSYGESVDGLRNVTTSNPITALSVAAGIGFFLGVMWSRRD